ncbi:MAG: dTDP-4-dehydrorhamnose reductase [Gemmatimonadetes bacterium]|nr:dTDP-4-dehydrorhamnose reductase [Gemmatimonadota bacterium]
MNLRLLIVGASGQLGSDVTRAARSRPGMDVVSLSREDLDLSRSDEIAGILGRRDFDVLINCAAHTGVDSAESDIAAAVSLNAHAVRELARACREAEARFVTFSTDYVFDGRADRPYAEEAAPRPLNVYGASKLMGEALAAAEWPEATYVIRTASLFGTGRLGRDGGNFVETMLRAASGGRTLRVVDDITMSPTWSGHLAPATLALLETDAPPGIYHLAGGGAASWYELAAAALSAAGVDGELQPVSVAEYPTPARRPAYSVLDCGRAAELGLRLPSWEEGLAAYMAERGRAVGLSAPVGPSP